MKNDAVSADGKDQREQEGEEERDRPQADHHGASPQPEALGFGQIDRCRGW